MSLRFQQGPVEVRALGGTTDHDEIHRAAQRRMRRDRGVHRRIARGLLSHEELHEYIADKRAIPLEMEE